MKAVQRSAARLAESISSGSECSTMSDHDGQATAVSIIVKVRRFRVALVPDVVLRGPQRRVGHCADASAAVHPLLSLDGALRDPGTGRKERAPRPAGALVREQLRRRRCALHGYVRPRDPMEDAGGVDARPSSSRACFRPNLFTGGPRTTPTRRRITGRPTPTRRRVTSAALRVQATFDRLPTPTATTTPSEFDGAWQAFLADAHADL